MRDWGILAAVIAAVTMAATANGYRMGAASVRREAVKAGAATYVAGEDGQPEFQWKGKE